MNSELEDLRQELLETVCAGAYSGLGSMILDADKIRNADADELEQLARQYGHSI